MSLALQLSPCTFYSKLMRLWNFGKMTKAEIRRRGRYADKMLTFAIDCACQQIEGGLGFIFEHPQGATSWNHPKMLALEARPGVQKANFDQCRFGLKAPITGEPIRKTTTIIRHSPGVQHVFHGCRCKCRVPHRRIQGSIGPYKLSVWCQRYHDELVDALLDAIDLPL